VKETTVTGTYAPSGALVIVDMQHDFADPAGSLYVRGGEELVGPIADEFAAAQQAGATVVYTQDWHPEHTPHFQADGGLWPSHCVAGTEDGYSGFSEVDLATGTTKGTDLSTILDEAGVMDLTVVGLAGDWCVKATAIDGVRLGYSVTVPLALTRFVELTPGDTERAVADMRAAGVTVTD
jgi:nicotinamidase/pyrazinamidase